MPDCGRSKMGNSFRSDKPRHFNGNRPMRIKTIRQSDTRVSKASKSANPISKIFAIYVKISAVQNIAVAQLEHLPDFHLETAGQATKPGISVF
jgi:hypothetical protein